MTENNKQSISIEKAFQSVFEGTAMVTGVEFFRSLVNQLTSVLNVQYAFVGELLPGGTGVRTLSVRAGGMIVDNFEYDLAGTPCENVVDQAVCFYADNIQARFPEDTMLVDMRAESYLGAPLLDADGTPRGLLAVLDTRALEDVALVRQLLSIFAARAGAELGRKQAESKQAELERQLRQSHKMEAIGTLAGGIAHDFNNTLNAIMGFSKLLLADLPEGSEPHEFAEQISVAGRRASDLVQQILTFSRESEQERQHLQLGSIVSETVKLLKGSFPATVELREINNSGSETVLADAAQIHQILMNLCTNAYHAMRETGGVIELELRSPVEVDAEMVTVVPGLALGRYVELAVRDTGEGMANSTIERIFEPYFTTKKQGDGTGLGLASVYGIVKNHNGAIIVESELGVGTVFRIYLPISIEEGGEQDLVTTDDAPPLPQLNCRVLFIDDVEFNALLGKYALERLGCEVVISTDSLEALELFKNDPAQFDLVITDQTMPNMTGFDLAKQMLSIRPEVKIFMVTGHSDIVDRKKALSVGIKDFFVKPLDPDSLCRAIKDVLPCSGGSERGL